jgi:hypothetical protein
MLVIFLWCILPLCLPIYLYLNSNQVLIKFDQLKLLNAFNLSAFSCLTFWIHTFPHFLSTTCAHPCYKKCCSIRGSYYEDVAGARRTQPPVDCLWCSVPSFRGFSIILWLSLFFLRDTVSVFTYIYIHLYVTIRMKIGPGIHIVMHLVFVDGRFPLTKSTCYTLVWALNYN